MKQGFTLVELLVVISVIAVLLGILIPSLSRAREQAKIAVVNTELRQIALALEVYFENNQKYPPTQADCSSSILTDHMYQLPTALVKGDYLPATPRTNPMSTTMEDQYNRGHTYKYRSVGEIIKDRNRIHTSIWAKLWIPKHFPESSSIATEEGEEHPNANEVERYSNDKSRFAPHSPVSWVVFSLGPRFSMKWLEEKIGIENRYPVPKELWYTPKQRRGFIVRMRLKNGSQIGSFE
ncbi:MAG: type II secretion system protein [Phycisphaerales bacterium]|jgi:prepilin-type N-terminal cleavage/methylation domain-containing protein